MKHATIIASTVLIAMLAISGCNAGSQNSNQEKTVMSQTITEFTKIDHKIGTGREAEAGLNVTVHYTGWLYDPSKPEGKGEKFDSSLDRGEPFVFYLGGGQVIRGWDEGFAGMKIGGTRTLLIPAEYGYGARGAGGVIPPNASLVFDVELLGIK
ncbi:MAG: FKBP-type peptidyl-prolyl cis-trans isomerase [Methylophilaceae bacterium]|uniref:FKBP-type peptidyl-prolyl cis-trans isomerase n=1 Tax=Methylovorus sp. MM2 TaxID=1848038 RepID=UPI001C27C951|nr:FKBP-type peptidyl-prolyl cis-trans isomerase [Methylovorus sp. MM2]